jgi:hypothetical protein
MTRTGVVTRSRAWPKMSNQARAAPFASGAALAWSFRTSPAARPVRAASSPAEERATAAAEVIPATISSCPTTALPPTAVIRRCARRSASTWARGPASRSPKSSAVSSGLSGR